MAYAKPLSSNITPVMPIAGVRVGTIGSGLAEPGAVFLDQCFVVVAGVGRGNSQAELVDEGTPEAVVEGALLVAAAEGVSEGFTEEVDVDDGALDSMRDESTEVGLAEGCWDAAPWVGSGDADASAGSSS